MLLCIFLNENLDSRIEIHSHRNINTVVLDDPSKRIRHAVRCDGVVYFTLQLQSCRHGLIRGTATLDTRRRARTVFRVRGLIREAIIVIFSEWKENDRWTSGFVSVSQYSMRIGIIAVAQTRKMYDSIIS